MQKGYTKIIRNNLALAFSKAPADFAKRLGARREENSFSFKAFGAHCTLTEESIFLNGKPEHGPIGVVISLYAVNASAEPLVLEPFKAFQDFPNSMPYHGPFKANTELPLIRYVEMVAKKQDMILSRFDGHQGPKALKGDLCFVVYPLPKVALAYIFYFSDEDFPASATCLFSSNALSFLPLDALADLGEYTTKAIIQLVSS